MRIFAAMKKIIGIVILLVLHLICLGQSEYDEFDPFGQEEGKEDATAKRDSVEVNVPHFRYTWQWKRGGVYPQEVPLDTLQDGIQNFNLIFKESISNTYLGNFPSPYESNIFIERNPVQDFYPLTYMRAYLYMPEDSKHFNTTTPYTRLRYYTGGGKGKAENMLDVWHVQNILPFWSAGLRYRTISGDGRYANQKTKVSTFSFFTSYERERWVLSGFLSRNKGEIEENGGIADRYQVVDTVVKAENIPVNLQMSEVYNNFRNINFQVQGQYNIGKAKELITPVDTSRNDTSYTYPAKVVLNIRTEGNRHSFEEGSINEDFYRHTYIDSSQTNDTYNSKLIEVSAKFVLNEHPKYKYLPGLYAGLEFKREKYDQRIDYDTLSVGSIYGTDTYMGTFLTAGIFNVDTNAALNYDVQGRLGLLGYYAGNFKIDGYIRQALNKEKTTFLRADANIQLQSVNPFLNHYVGTHDQWENDFKAVKTIDIRARYVNQRLRTDVGASFTNIFSHVYFDSTIMPRQTSKALIVFTAWAKEVFKAGPVYFDQRVYVQKSTQEDILSLPTVALYSHNYYQDWLFKHALELQFGIDLFYNTSFYADNYMPSIMQFYNQKVYKTGNYPKVDVFLNLHIKRAQLFVKYEHVNFHLKERGNFFSAADYPINPAMLKFGVQWDFFD